MSAPTLISTHATETGGNPTISDLTLTKGQFVMAFLMLQDTNTPTISDSNNLIAWNLLQSGTFGSGSDSTYVWYGTVQTSGNTSVVATVADGGDFVVNVYSSAAIDVYSPITQGTDTTAIASAAINTNYANELIVGWASSKSGLSTTTPANPPFTFDQSIPATTLNGTESETASSTGSFQSSFTGQDAGSGFPWASGIFALYNPAMFTISGDAGTTATVSYSGTASGSVTTDGSGNFTISGLAPGTYTISPARTGYTFSPTSQTETISNANITNVNFVATQVQQPSTRFTFFARHNLPGYPLYDVMDGASTNDLGRTIAGSGALVGQLFFDNIVAQAWSFSLKKGMPFIAAGSVDAEDIESFALSLPAPPGVTIVQPGPTPSTRFAFTAVTRRSGQTPLAYLVSDGPSIAYGSIGQLIWDGVFARWCMVITNASAEVNSPADVACITTFAASLPLISPNEIQL